MTGTVLLLTPSRGRGGGIERYVETVEWALGDQGMDCCRIDLEGPGVAAHRSLLRDCQRRFTGGDRFPARLVVAHRAMLPAAALLTRHRRSCGISVICHGVEVWAAGPKARRALEDRLMRRPGTRIVAVSNFTAGTLLTNCQATILPPGLSANWFATLVDAAKAEYYREPGIHLMTAFRLVDFRSKGLPELLAAVARLGRPDVRMTVCGSGLAPDAMCQLIGEYPWCRLRSGLSNEELAAELASADLFVLASRTRHGQGASGEGSHEAFLRQVTGEAPVDETAESLSAVLDRLLKDPARLEQMGRQAAQWSRKCFAPDAYASRVVSALL